MSFVTNKAKAEFAKGTFDWVNDSDIEIALVTAISGDVDSDTINGTITELNCTGYSSGWGNNGRKALFAKVVDEDDAGNQAKLRASSLKWETIGTGAQTVIGGVIHKKGAADDTTSIFIAYIELDASRVLNGGDFTFHFASPSGGVGTVISFTEPV